MRRCSRRRKGSSAGQSASSSNSVAAGISRQSKRAWQSTRSGYAMNSEWLTVPDSMHGVLRDYQLKLIDEMRAAFEQHQRVLVQAPTGSGKTHIITATAAAAAHAGLRVLILATRTRIVRQVHERLESFSIEHGVIAAALPGLRWNAAAIQIASVDTLYRRCIVDRRMPLPPADLIVFDEAHLSLGQSRVAILEQYPDAFIFGTTATPAKTSGRALRDRFDTLILGPTVRQLIDSGGLVRTRIFAAPAASADELSAIDKDSKTGDYVVEQIGALMDHPKLIGDVVENWLAIANGKRTLLFACTKGHGRALTAEFLQQGIAAELLTDQTPEDEREAAVSRLESGATMVLVNCFLLSYGVDIPAVECVQLARPTRSVVLYLQCVGRGARPSPGKRELLLIDHGRVVENLGFPDADFGWTLEVDANVNTRARAIVAARRATAEQPRTCPECHHMWLASEESACGNCGWLPAPKAQRVEVTEAQLSEITAGAREQQPDQFFRQALGWYRSRWPDRWAQREKSGRWWAWQQTREVLKLECEKPPSRYWGMAPMAPSAPVAGKLHSRRIAYVKARR
jgi:DNA repair protein RadD